ncbi:hypothetical protein Dimus_022660, partial [Dionaea muscipula]
MGTKGPISFLAASVAFAGNFRGGRWSQIVQMCTDKVLPVVSGCSQSFLDAHGHSW